MIGLAAAAVATPAIAANAEHGKVLYRTCISCHTEKPDGIGPRLAGVIGRRTGSLDDFRYSAAMRRASFTWDEHYLRAYIVDPQATVKGNRMPFGGLPNANDADDIIAHLKTLQ